MSSTKGTTPGSLTLRLFGSFEATLSGVPLPPTRTRKELLLLSLLALLQGRPAERDWLCAVLWPDSNETTARFYLRRSLSNLRSVLGDEQRRILTSPLRSVALDICGVALDVHAFESHMASGDDDSLVKAVDIYQGALLAGCEEEVVLSHRIRYEQEYLLALDTLARRAHDRHEWVLAAGFARRIIGTDPLQESAYRILMQSLAASGSHTAAVLAYRDLRLRLNEEIQSEPDAQTRALFDQIRSRSRNLVDQQPGLTPPSPFEGGELNSYRTNSSTLPTPITRLIGREEPLAEALALLSGTRLLTLTGVGGVGKTRLAVEIGSTLSAERTEGVAFVDLAPLKDARYVVQTVAAALGIKGCPDAQQLKFVADHVASRSLLIVLDNCEHLMDECRKLVRTLLQSCPLLRVMCTSRQSLGLPGEVVLLIHPLSVPPPIPEHRRGNHAQPDVNDLLQYASVQLFLERIVQLQPGYRLTVEAAHRIGRICRRVDGVPLALELAAGRARALSFEQIEQRMNERFSLLTGGDRSSHRRQWTLRAVLDWSFALLDTEEQRLLARLAIFTGGWSLDAAENVCANCGIDSDGGNASVARWEVLDLLDGLVDRSLVAADECGGRKRYRMLESVREYAREKLAESGDIALIRKQHTDWFLRLAEEASINGSSPAQSVIMHALLVDLDNLRTAMETCLSVHGDTTQGIRLGIALQYFWFWSGLYSEGRNYLRILLARSGCGELTPERGDALKVCGALAYEQDKYAEAAADFEQARRVYIKLEDQDRIAAVQFLTGLTAYMQGDNDRGLALLQENLAYYRANGRVERVGAVLRHIAIVFRRVRENGKAIACLEESLEITRRLGIPTELSSTLTNLAILVSTQGDKTRALQLFEESRTILRELGNHRMYATILVNLGTLHAELGNDSVAENHLAECLTICADSDYKRIAVHALLGLAGLAYSQHQFKRSLLLYAAERRLRLGMQITITDNGVNTEEQHVSTIRTAMHSDAFETLWNQGEAMSPEDWLAVARDSTG